MKNISLVFLPLIFVLSCLSSHAQVEISVTNENVSMSKGNFNAYIVEIPQADYEKSLKNWEKAIRQNTKNKIQEADHEIIMEGTLIELIYNKPINIYSALLKKDTSLRLFALFEIDSLFFDFSSSEKTIREEKIHSQIKHFLLNFATEQYLFAVEQELEKEENTLKEHAKEMGNFAKEKESLLKSIAENQQKIKNSEDAIASLNSDNERKLSEINSKKEAMASIGNDPELSSQAKEQLKSLEKEKKDIENKLEKEQKNIVEYNSTIESLNKEVQTNQEKQVAKQEELDKQLQVVESVRKKLSGIR